MSDNQRLCLLHPDVPHLKYRIMKTRFLPGLLVLLAAIMHLAAQPECSDLNFQLHTDLPSDCAHMTMTMQHDRQGHPFLYVAGKEGGLKIYNIADPDDPFLAVTLPVSAWDGLDLMNLSQQGNYLYLALGNHFSQDQHTGMAIVDITDPASPEVTDYYVFSDLFGGAGIVLAEGDYAYLGAMMHGLAIFDISDKTEISLVSLFQPDIFFPDPNPDPAKFNARGLAIREGKAYLCYDAGGLRIIDVQDPAQPEEIGRYSNPVLNGKPRAYNNIALDGDLAYIAVDFCGLEILNIANPAQITEVSWWNPWNCDDNPLFWFSSPGHANEIHLNRDCHWVFLSTGKSDMYVVDVSDPTAPDSCNIYGGVDNGVGTWGISSYADKIFLSYICAGFPFVSIWTGVRVLTYNNPCLQGAGAVAGPAWKIYPNPAGESLHISAPFYESFAFVRVSDALGRRVGQFPVMGNETDLDISNWPGGMYFLQYELAGISYSAAFVKK